MLGYDATAPDDVQHISHAGSSCPSPPVGDGSTGAGESIAASSRQSLPPKNRSHNHRENRDARRAADDERCPEVAIEAAASQAAANTEGVSIFQLHTTYITPATEQMMLAFEEDVYHMQEILKDRSQCKALLARLRVRGYQCVAASSVMQQEGLSAGVLTTARKTVDVELPCQGSDCITGDPRCIWPRIRMKGWNDPILTANVYCKCGLSLKGQKVDYLRSLTEASDQCRRYVMGFGDWNVTPEELVAFVLLDGLGLEVVIPPTAP